MNEITGSIAKSPGLSVYQERGRDPTQTTALRLRFSREMTKRFRHLRGLIRRAIVDEDVFGLRQITTQQTPGREAFDFTRSSEKVSAFMQWFRRQIQDGILEVTSVQQVGLSVDAAWTNLYIRQGYSKGVKRARTQLRQAGYNVPSIEETGGLQAAINAPIHADRLGLLYTRTFNDLKGVTDAMDQHISRILAQGIAEGVNPNELADRLTATIRGGGGELGITDTLGRYIPAERRAKMLARTEIIRAHSHAQIQTFKNWGAEGVTAIVEFQTAGDNRVCTQCAGLQGSFFTLDEALAIIPVHVSCRCAWLPVPKDFVERGLVSVN